MEPQFIPYLGNKRKLLPHILSQIDTNQKILDLFSGSGVVAYHLRNSGKTVIANDIAPYSYWLNFTHLEANDTSELTNFLEKINASAVPHTEYFAKYYSQNPNASKERIYYTRQNGLFLDAALEIIWNESNLNLKAPALCSLLYKMSTHVNTSGVFKSWHKQFAGGERHTGVHKRVHKCNLKRILTPIQLEKPIFPNGPQGKTYQIDALDFFNQVSDHYDLIYIDPPYNHHQYSGNYHLLEQACRPLHERYIPTDDQVSGIQPNLYKSPFCSKRTYLEAFEKLIEQASKHSPKILFSYNSNGYMSKTELETLIGQYYSSVETQEIAYFNYRGGKQAKKPVQEYLINGSKD